MVSRRNSCVGEAETSPEARELSKLLGGADVCGHSAGKVLAVLSEIHEKRFGRKMIKPLDLTHFVTYDKEKGATTITSEVLAQLQEATKDDADGLKSIVDGLNDLHLRIGSAAAVRTSSYEE